MIDCQSKPLASPLMELVPEPVLLMVLVAITKLPHCNFCNIELEKIFFRFTYTSENNTHYLIQKEAFSS
jgi:hypothetical protein